MLRVVVYYEVASTIIFVCAPREHPSCSSCIYRPTLLAPVRGYRRPTRSLILFGRQNSRSLPPSPSASTPPPQREPTHRSAMSDEESYEYEYDDDASEDDGDQAMVDADEDDEDQVS